MDSSKKTKKKSSNHLNRIISRLVSLGRTYLSDSQTKGTELIDPITNEICPKSDNLQAKTGFFHDKPSSRIGGSISGYENKGLIYNLEQKSNGRQGKIH
jgi:hypothetical protein